MEENIKVKIGNLIKLEDGTIVQCCKTSSKVTCCDVCYFNNKQYNCSLVCSSGIRCHYKKVQIIAIKDFKPDRLK